MLEDYHKLFVAIAEGKGIYNWKSSFWGSVRVAIPKALFQAFTPHAASGRALSRASKATFNLA